jgi:glycosidase
VFPDAEDSNWDYDEVAGKWFLHRFYSHMPDLNIANPRVRDEIARLTLERQQALPTGAVEIVYACGAT